MTLVSTDSATTSLLEQAAQGDTLTPEQRWALACGLLDLNANSREQPSWHFRLNEARFLAEVLAFWPTGPAFLNTLRAFASASTDTVLAVLDQLVTQEGRVRFMLDEAQALGPKSLNYQVMLGAQARVMKFYLDWERKQAKPHQEELWKQ